MSKEKLVFWFGEGTRRIDTSGVNEKVARKLSIQKNAATIAVFSDVMDNAYRRRLRIPIAQS